MNSRILRRDIMTKWLRHSPRRRNGNRSGRDIAKAWHMWRRQRKMMGTSLMVYFMVLNCMAW
jgi:uncharacterized membrane protein